MRLIYLKGDKITVNWKETDQKTEFLPEADVSDELGNRLLSNPQYLGWFKRVDVPPAVFFPCEVCGQRVKSKAALGSHLRKHKEKS